jgi:glycosyltransferase involved in cell wall biosynthesis
MRLLHVSYTYFPFLHTGGPPVVVEALATGMAGLGHDVTVLTVEHKFSCRARRSRLSEVDLIYLASPFRYRQFSFNPGVLPFCRSELAKFDVVHIYGFYDFMGPVVAAFCRQQGVPYVVEPFGMFPPIERSIRKKWLYHRFVGENQLSGAARIIASSELERTQLITTGVAADRVLIRRNGVDFTPDVLPPRGQFREPLRISSEERVILYLGRLTAKKQPDVLLRAFANLADGNSRLVIAGPNEDGWRKRLESLSSDLHMGDRVLFTGMLTGEKKLAALVDADIFVLPSRSENFGIAAAEAIACSTPVVVTPQCGIAALVRDRVGLVVSPTEEAIQGGLHRLLEDRQLYSRMVEAASAMAQELTWEGPIKETETLYRTLADTAG